MAPYEQETLDYTRRKEQMDLRTLSGLGAKCWYFTAATASQTGCGKQEGDSLRVPLLWRHSWAEQDLLQTTTRETESIWFNRCPSRQAPEELAANPAMLEASSAAQPISDITGHWKFCWDNPPNEFEAFYSNVYRCTAGGVAQTEQGLHQGCSLDRANSLDQ
ncbi:uncharacterized protein LOC121816219 isoform X3 [Ovis aries]|uniref:uncharacterized protein LOC121816219 isoform X3 n=1 Tax=Ovis aries TaxID=9940 RepID=UPI002952703E|nr:uncharacterized protein LOC121816219 isoform X3 [Ovis aries]